MGLCINTGPEWEDDTLNDIQHTDPPIHPLYRMGILKETKCEDCFHCQQCSVTRCNLCKKDEDDD